MSIFTKVLPMTHTFIHDLIREIALLFPTFLLLFTVRGFFQAASARLMGDNTPSYSGFLTLNPLAHIDVMGLLLLSVMFGFVMLSQNMMYSIIIILLLIFVGMRPYHPVPVNSDNFRHYRLGIALTALSGSLSYFLLTLVALYVLTYCGKLLGLGHSVYLVIEQIAVKVVQLALFWGVIGLVPIPPFDASALLPLFGQVGQDIYDFLEQYALFIFFGLFFIPGVSGIFMHILDVLRALIYAGLVKLLII